MVSIDYMAHQEQYDPNELLEYSSLAEDAGYDFVWTSDHFHPWFHTDAEAGFAWSWLGAACERLDIPIGTCVSPATGHYHPGIIAQAFATLQSMHDERVVLGLSTGEAMNETPLGFDWPEYPERRDRLEESLRIIRALWGDEQWVDSELIGEDGFVTYDGDRFELNEAKLYTNPERSPEIHIAANGPSTARLAARYADGFITVKKGEEYTDRLYPAIRRYAEEEGNDPDAIETTLLVIASYDPDYEAALEATRPWWATTQNVFDRAMANPMRIEREGEKATREQVEEKFLIADEPETIAAQLEEYAEMGFDRIAIGNTSPDPAALFDVMGDDVIPSL
ncbi:TIGR03557 family F420-dependent LLM class oxidoreductase [Natrarchaeobius halalkaliphilus]|uniref:TIGR03557 family F420-dependent LLM class oxidoreductase n=1 Tax=Natrarchaeobius halalkaliphilus TaxID=1679091 RepID=A0A3N6LL62_9EURY|nr:TIGR03557 family F420-dependent LLM class oxidoreductase [Natrarchaeobius halalkaliphilus]RQG87790.1 TIGR03557 family F420-dependent LLM class oxidoreductase [Natrarchaeobius halalkaliphilus]